MRAKGWSLRKTICIATLFSMACWAAFGRRSPAVPATPVEFEAATVRPAQAPGGASYFTGIQFDAAQVRMTGMSLADLILYAYGVKAFQVSGPAWMGSQFYDIAAGMPAGAKPEQVPAMLQKLLARRFQLKVHRESKALPAYALAVAGGGMKIHASGASQPAVTSISAGHMEAHGASLSALAASLSESLGRPVADDTGVSGLFDFTLDWALEAEHNTADIPSIRAALRDNLGLKLEPRKLPVEMLIVDHVDKKPSEN